MAKQAFPERLEMAAFGDGEHWYLLEPFVYYADPRLEPVVVPKGFVTDMASVPSVLESIVPRWGPHGPAAVVHDFLYWEQRCTQRQADALMLRAMRQMGTGTDVISAVANALDYGGPSAWQSNSELRVDGFVRVIPEEHFPGGGLTSWRELRDELRERGFKPRSLHSEAAPGYCGAG